MSLQQRVILGLHGAQETHDVFGALEWLAGKMLYLKALLNDVGLAHRTN